MAEDVNYSVADIRMFDDESFNEFYSYISKHRQEKADSYKLKNDRKLSILSSYQLEKLFSFMGVKEPYNYSVLPNGKPILLGDDISFSLTHSGNYAACAVSRKYDVGIDVEDVMLKKRRMDRLKKAAYKFFLEDEIKYIDFEMCDNEPIHNNEAMEHVIHNNEAVEHVIHNNEAMEHIIRDKFFKIWTFKEAYMKAKGISLIDAMKKDIFSEGKDTLVQKHTSEAVLSIYKILRSKS